jgi:hypothetical protein
VLRDRAELGAVDALIDQLGWRLEQPAAPARLSGDGDLLTEIARSALSNAVDDPTDALQSLREGRVASKGPRPALGPPLRQFHTRARACGWLRIGPAPGGALDEGSHEWQLGHKVAGSRTRSAPSAASASASCSTRRSASS